MSHYTFYMDEILNKNYLFQEEEPLFSTSYFNLNSLLPALTSNTYTFIYHKLTAYSYAKYKEKYDYSRQKRRSFYAK